MGIMSAWGAFIGLLVSIFLIIRKVSPVYSLILGALVGGLLGGVSLPETVSLMISGVNDVTPAVIRILTAGVLSGILVKTGAAASISNTIIYRLGERHVFFALAFATMLLTAIGVFIDVAVITVAPIEMCIRDRYSMVNCSRQKRVHHKEVSYHRHLQIWHLTDFNHSWLKDSKDVSSTIRHSTTK